MSKTTEISRKEIEYRELLYSLYFDLMNEIKGGNIKYDKEEYEENISTTEIPIIINFIKETIPILINKKINEENNKNFIESSKKINENEQLLYENRLKYLESQLRFYIKKQLQYKIQKESFENKIKNYMNIQLEFEEMKQKLKYEDGKFMNNDRKDNEIEILRRENSNLKKAILKIEKENILIESKRIEEKKLIENLKEQNEKYKKLIKKLEQSQKDISTNSSINININNTNNQGSNLIINKNIETNNSNSSNSKKQIYNNKNYKTNIIDNYAFTSAYNKILNSISNKTPKKIPKHRKTNSMNMNIDDNKKNDIISKYFTNQKICNSSIKQYKNYAKISGGSYNKPISNRKINQISFVSKIYNKDKKLNKSINRSTLNKRPCSKDYY